MAFYFAWMNFYTTFAIIPALIGLAMYSLRPSGVTVDDDAFLPFFSVIMSLWGVFFLVVSSMGDMDQDSLSCAPLHEKLSGDYVWSSVGPEAEVDCVTISERNLERVFFCCDNLALQD